MDPRGGGGESGGRGIREGFGTENTEMRGTGVGGGSGRATSRSGSGRQRRVPPPRASSNCGIGGDDGKNEVPRPPNLPKSRTLLGRAASTSALLLLLCSPSRLSMSASASASEHDGTHPLLLRLGLSHPGEIRRSLRPESRPPMRREDVDPTKPVDAVRYVRYGYRDGEEEGEGDDEGEGRGGEGSGHRRRRHPYDAPAEAGLNRRVDGGRIRRLLLADSGEDEDEDEEKEGGTRRTARRVASASLWQDQHDLYLQDLLSFEEGWRDEDEVEEDGTKSDDDSSPPSSSSPSSFLHHPLRIRFESSELDAWASLSPEYALRVQYLTHRVLPSMSQIWSSALRVVPVSGLLRIDRDWCPFGDPDHPSFGVDGGGRGMEDVDLLVYLTANGEACGGGDDDYGSDGLYRSGGDRDKGMGGSGGGGNGDDGDDGYGSDELYRSGGDGDGDEGKGSGGGGGGGNGVLASAVSCFWDQYDRPVAGNIDFCLGTVELGRESDDMDRPGGDSPSSASSGTTASRVDGGSRRREDRADEKKEKESSSDRLLEMAVGTATHEFAHILGITSADLLYYYDWRTGLPRTPDPVMKRVQCVGRLSGGGAAASEAWEDHYVPLETTLKPGRTPGGALYYEITTPTVAQVVRNQFDCPSATGARLENQPTSGDCFGNHFDERLFFSENMSPVLAGIPEVMLSSLTLATLRDTGWYVPDFSVARVSPFGNGAGCDFLYEDCLDRDWGGALTPSSEGYFCNQMYGFDDKGKFAGGYGCDPTHTHVSICDLVDYGTLRVPYDPPPAEYRYFDGDSGEGDDYDGGGEGKMGRPDGNGRLLPDVQHRSHIVRRRGPIGRRRGGGEEEEESGRERVLAPSSPVPEPQGGGRRD